MDDTKLSDELKYQKGKIFEDDGRTFRPILKKEDIIMISDFLKNIKFRGKGFDELCENWKDENHEIIDDGIILREGEKELEKVKGRSI